LIRTGKYPGDWFNLTWQWSPIEAAIDPMLISTFHHQQKILTENFARVGLNPHRFIPLKIRPNP
jgi:hypothetical protein